MNYRTHPAAISVFGAFLFLLTTVHHALEIASIGSVGLPIVAWGLDGGLAVGVIYLGWRLTDAEFSASEYGAVLRWTVGGAVAGGGLIGMTLVVRAVEGRALAEPVFPLLVGTNGGALVATIAGYYAAQSMATARKFEGIFDNTYQFTGLLERDGTVIEANDTVLSFGGLDREDVVGEKLWNAYWIEPYEESRETVKQAVTEARQGDLFREQIRIRGETGSAIIDFSVRPIYDESGDVVRLVPEGRDITRIQRQQELLSVLHRYLRHNLRNDLNTIQGYAALLLDKLDKELHTNRVETIHRTAANLSDSSELVKEFVETTSGNGDETRPRRLDPIVNKACDRASIPPSRFDIDIRSDAAIHADDRIYLVFEEFLSALGTHIENGGDVMITDTRSGNRVEVEIECAGFDVPAVELSAFDRAAERSSTYHPRGVRFWLMKSVVKEYGGSVAYDDQPADGTDITLAFERAPKGTDIGIHGTAAD